MILRGALEYEQPRTATERARRWVVWLPTRAFIYIGREDRFGEMFARGPLYEQANERGELDWRTC